MGAYTLYTLYTGRRMCALQNSAHQILHAVVIKVSAALWEAAEQDFDQTLVPGWTHA